MQRIAEIGLFFYNGYRELSSYKWYKRYPLYLVQTFLLVAFLASVAFVCIAIFGLLKGMFDGSLFIYNNEPADSWDGLR